MTNREKRIKIRELAMALDYEGALIAADVDGKNIYMSLRKCTLQDLAILMSRLISAVKVHGTELEKNLGLTPEQRAAFAFMTAELLKYEDEAGMDGICLVGTASEEK